MTMTAEEKADIIREFQQESGDTGSPEVQIALLTARIKDLSPHFKEHIHDHHSRQGLLRMVNRRRKLLDYLKRNELERYQKVIKDLGLRK